jgi:hypothetical protein
VDQLRARVKALEGGLRNLQADVSDEPHPLLLEAEGETLPDHQLQYNRTALTLIMQEPAPSISREEEEFIGAFGKSVRGLSVVITHICSGTLTLGLRGESRYYGSTSRPEVRPLSNTVPTSPYSLLLVSYSCENALFRTLCQLLTWAYRPRAKVIGKATSVVQQISLVLAQRYTMKRLRDSTRHATTPKSKRRY